MTWPFQRIPVSVSLPSAPTLLASDIAPLIPTPPPVDYYWLLGDDNPQLLDQLTGAPLRRTINFTKPGTMNGYTVAPNITISSGGGSGATAQAVIDGAGVLQKVYLTDPGIGYTSSPTATVVPIGAGTAGNLTVQIGDAPTLSAGFITIPTSSNNHLNGLVSPQADAASQTMIAILRPQGGAGVGQILFGALTENATYGPGGDALYYYVNGWRMQTAPGAYAAVTPSGISLNEWTFVAVTQDNATDTRRVSFGRNGQLQHFVTPSTHKNAASPARKVALGNANYNASGFYTSLDAALFQVKAGALSVDDLTDIFYQESSVVAQRGVIIP